MTAAHFCDKTGARIAAPGVSLAVDSDKGHHEVDTPDDVHPAEPSESDVGAIIDKFHAGIKAAHEKLEAVTAELDAAKADVAKLTADNESLAGANKALNAELDAAKADVAKLTSALDAYKSTAPAPTAPAATPETPPAPTPGPKAKAR